MAMRTLRMLSGMAGVAGTLWLGMLASITASQHKLLFNPIRIKEVDRPRSTGHRTRPVVLRCADGTRLCGWFLRPHGLGHYPAVVYFGGRSEEVSWVVRDAENMFPGMAVLVLNYRGYGDSHGEPGEPQLVEDAQVLFDWLAANKHIDAERIAVVGRSLGSGVAIQLAALRRIAALVLLTPFDSLLELAKRRFKTMPISLVLKHRFESVRYAEAVTAPVLVLRASSDRVVPHSHTDLLVARMRTVEMDHTVSASDHMTIPYLPETQTKIAAFLRARFIMMSEENQHESEIYNQ
ncbi:hypothetical protein SAMN06265795_103334 [Noviherbaspirillum humi]|uniref:Serine aminopeptidase S33 domain-containing protein n=1 Tax=Noviherbaspirillum humi TaxID=1688639 RepID=A0A239FGY5_9BURK|nr:alpha/beta fold hydrolase [Noviherbaspirillum humi]SNS55573.1 hypothetical protein SAMN06265795_103334 [Noviherbaspirillum humi]